MVRESISAQMRRQRDTICPGGQRKTFSTQLLVKWLFKGLESHGIFTSTMCLDYGRLSGKKIGRNVL